MNTAQFNHNAAPNRDGNDSTSRAFRVLIVDEHANHQKALSLLLTRVGMESDVAGDGERAVALVIDSMVQGRPFDVVVMDVHLPKLDGWEAASQLRACGFPGLIIAHVGPRSEGDEATCLRAGFDCVLQKPCSQADLIRVIQGHLCRRPFHEKRTSIDTDAYQIEDYCQYLVVRVRGSEVWPEKLTEQFREDLSSVVDIRSHRAVIFDLSQSHLPSSQMLALFVMCFHRKLRVHLCNPSQETRDALQATKLDTLFSVSALS
jgi:CheY-like chemotaxis protein